MAALPTPTSTLAFGSSSDDLTTVVVRRLDYKSGYRAWGLLKTVLLGVWSFGLLPLLIWPIRFREHAAEESEALKELAQWAKHRGREPAAVGPLLAAAEGTIPSPVPMVLCVLLAALVVGVYVIQFSNIDFSVDRLLSWTYSSEGRFSGSSPLSRQEFVYRVWVIALSVGYTIQWLQIRAHVSDVRRFVERFNPIATAERLPPVRMPDNEFVYFKPLWILTAVILGFYGAWWGIPMVLAGMAQRRYTCLTGRKLRNELSNRVKDVVMLRQLPLAQTWTANSRCGNPRCQAPMRSGSRFCTRCGSNSQEATRA